MRPPLRLVAERAGVSEATVSRVLNRKTGVSDRSRDAVHAALGELGFGKPAGQGSGRRRSMIGVVCGDMLNPVFPTLLHHISLGLARKGFVTQVAVTDVDLVGEERCIAELSRSGVDGYIFVGGRHAEVDGDLAPYRRLVDADAPIVFVSGRSTELPVPHVRCDEEAGGYIGTSHLLSLGHQRIGCVLGSRRFIPTQRFSAGYRTALSHAGLAEPDDAVIETSFTAEGGRAGARRLFDLGFTAMITGNDLMAIGAMGAATSVGLDPGGVVGYDGTELTAFVDPPLTTLQQPFEEMARLIVDAIDSEVDGTRSLRDQFVFEPKLLVGNRSRFAAGTRSDEP